MPSINITIGPLGPIAIVFLGVSAPREAALKAAGLPVPMLVRGQFLIDSGASSTVVDPALVNSLGLIPTGTVGIHTPSTNGIVQTCNQYDVALFIPAATGVPGCIVNALPIIESPLASQGIDGLIGRDLMDNWACFYNGPSKIFTFSY